MGLPLQAGAPAVCELVFVIHEFCFGVGLKKILGFKS